MRTIFRTFTLRWLRRIACAMLTAVMSLWMCACHDIEEFDNDTAGNFMALWTVVDEHYCFFQDKDIDWNEMKARYGKRVFAGINQRQLFDICADMLDELKDGHVNLSSSFNTSYYRDWWSLYPQNFDLRLIQEHYLSFDYRQLGYYTYSILPEHVGYVLVESFESELGESNLDAIFAYLGTCRALIIDVRNNGGGRMTAAEQLIRRFLDKDITAGYMINKTGPGHNDFSAPKAFTYTPSDPGRLRWGKDVVVLTNRSTFSAANHFVGVMRTLPRVKIVGATTGGGSGMPLSMELPNGWIIRMSAVSVLDPEGKVTEYGIEPSEGCAVDLDPQKALGGVDTMLDRAIEIALQSPDI
ncbi:MAG: S41 family peptidase [Muribaculaceae bacterium]